MLSEVFEYKDQEIAERLGISRGAVKAALHRAKVRLDSMPPNYAELLSVENEAQKEILKGVSICISLSGYPDANPSLPRWGS